MEVVRTVYWETEMTLQRLLRLLVRKSLVRR